MQQTNSSLNLDDGMGRSIKKSKRANKASREDLNGETKRKSKKKSNKQSKDGESNDAGNDNYQDMDYSTNEASNKSAFDSIWNPDQLAPKSIESANQLSTIGEEFSPLKLVRTKSYIGKVSKLDDEYIAKNSDAATRSLSFVKKDRPELDSNENAVLVQSSNASLNH